jgi:hypothetical protein
VANEEHRAQIQARMSTTNSLPFPLQHQVI